MKLLKAGLLREEGEGYTVDKVIFENMVRIKTVALPLQSAIAVFFLTSLVLLTTLLRPSQVTGEYVFSAAVIAIAFGISLAEALKSYGT
jgi:hypothetical protein